MKKNDVFQWGYKSIDGMFEPYWCKARICIVKEKSSGELYLEDIYGLSENKVFTIDEAEQKLDLTPIGNMDEFELKTKHDMVYYHSRDIMNLTHPNSYGSQIYIRKGAEKSLEKMRLIMQAHIDYYKRQADYAANEAKRLEEQLGNLTVDSYVPRHENVHVDAQRLN